MPSSSVVFGPPKFRATIFFIVFQAAPGPSQGNLNNTVDFLSLSNNSPIRVFQVVLSSCTQYFCEVISFQPSSMAQNKEADSPTLSEEDTVVTPAPVFQEPSNLPRPERKLTKEERDYLNTRLPEYHGLQSTLAARADGPRGVKNVKGKKKDWIRAHVFEDFKKKFNSAAPGGPALDSLFKVRSLCI